MESVLKVVPPSMTGTPVRCRGWIIGEPAHENGFVHAKVRDSGTILTLRIPNKLLNGERLFPESVVEADGTRNEHGCVEVATIFVRHKAEALPASFAHSDITDLNWRHIHIRDPRLRATAMFRHHIARYARQFLDDRGFFGVQTPILTQASCVCSGDVFTFPYYGKRIATLIQSPWMYADALVSSVERVYALNPSFRRERESTGIHLVEIWQLQVDAAWAINSDVMKMEEELVRYLATRLKEDHGDLYGLAGLDNAHLSAVIDRPFERMTYAESITLLDKLGYKIDYGSDYSKAHNDAIGKHVGRPYFVTEYPQRLKNFWFPVNGDGLTPSNDLFAHTTQGELIGGGERVSDTNELLKNLKFFGHDEDEFNWFVDVRRYGCVPHAGFSMGFDRICAFLMGVDDIRRASMFPRIPNGPLKP